MEFDWTGFEADLTRAAIGAVRVLLARACGQRPYAVAFSEFYAETCGVIYLPNLALATEESVPDPSCRFSPPDWEFQDDEWADTDIDWATRLGEAVTGLPRNQWEQVWERFGQAMLTIAAGVRAALPADMVVYLDDEAADLLIRSLSPEQLRAHFPEFVAARDAEGDILAMPVDRRVPALATAAGLVPRTPPSDLGAERARELLVELGQDAVGVGIAALAHPDTAWLGAKLLADLDIRSPEVVDALWAALPLTGNGHDWVAAALGRLGAGPQVVARGDLPAASRAAAVTAPYRSFRDHGRSHRPLDYRLLAAGLADPEIAAPVADELAPGRGYCTLDAADLPGARAGLDHPEPLIRRHAVVTLGELIGPLGPGDLGVAEVAALRTRIARAATDDPDAEVRRLAGYC